MRRVVGSWLAVAGAEVGVFLAGPPRLQDDVHVDTALAGLWLAVVVLGAYLCAVVGIGLLARLCRATTLVRLADAACPRSVRAWLDRSMSVLAGGALSMAVAVGPPITLRGLRPPAAVAAPTTTTVLAAPVAAPIVDVPAVGHDPPPPPPPGPTPPAHPTWEVRRGDHFWSIAQRVLADAWHRPVTDHEVVPYWRVLVDENRARLADPANPDLLFAGQALVVPPPPAPG